MTEVECIYSGGSGSAQQQYALEAPTLLQFVRTERLLDAKVLVRATESAAAQGITHSAARVVEPATRRALSCSYWQRYGQNQQGPPHANHCRQKHRALPQIRIEIQSYPLPFHN